MNSNDNASSDSIKGRWHFGVPIYEKHLPAFMPHQRIVSQRIHELRDADTGVNRSNQGGWHSSDDLHLKPDEHLHTLMLSLLQLASACIRDFEGEREYQDIRMVASWANLNHKGDWNAPHEHLPCTWSGVFYVDAGEPLSAADPKSLEGKILFFDPLPLGKEWKRPPNIAYAPVSGTMLLFPSYLTHMVAPYQGEKARISIAFNLIVDR